MKKMLNNWFSDKNTPKEQDPSSDDIYLDHSTDRTADLQEALISANLAFKEKEEAFKQKEEAFRQKEESCRQKEEVFRQKEEIFRRKEEDLSAREKLCSEKEKEFADRIKSMHDRERQLNELQYALNERQISFSQKPVTPEKNDPDAIRPEVIRQEIEIPSGLLARLEKIEAALEESSHKDKIIRELHDDLQKKNRNFYAELTRPAIKSIIRIHDFVAGTLKAANKKEEEDPDAAINRLRQAVEGNCLMIEDLLNDEFNIIMFAPEKGDAYLPKEHTAIISIDTEDPELAGTIQECRQAGFKEFETGRIVKSAVVTVYKMKKK